MKTTRMRFNRWYPYWACPDCGGELEEIPGRAYWLCAKEGNVVKSPSLWKARHYNTGFGTETTRCKINLEEELTRKPTTLQPG